MPKLKKRALASSECRLSMKLHHIQIHDGIATVTLARPEIHNAFNDELIAELTATFESLANSASVRAVVLTGEGKSFCAGADLNWMKRMKDYGEAENIADAKRLADLFYTIDTCPVPVIGAIHGAALGGGAGLVAVCDYVIAAEDTVFGFTEARLGLVPAVISPFVMAKIGRTYARATFLSGRRFDGGEAMQMGLVHRLCPSALLNAELEAAIEEFKKAAPKAAREAKQLIRGVQERDGDTQQQIDFTCRTIARLRAGAEGQEGMAALLEKRRANWGQHD